MDEIIRRQDALEAINRIWDRCEEIEAHLPDGDPDKTGYKMIGDYLTVWKYLSAQPERKTGKWIERNSLNSDRCRLIECSECGSSYIVGYNVPYETWIKGRNFCFSCGARMEGDSDVE